MKNEFFTLNPDVFLVRGAKRGALYDLKNGDVFSISENVTMLLNLCEQGRNLSRLSNETKASKQEVNHFLFEMQKLQLGVFSQHPMIQQSIEINESLQKLNFLWMELTSSCNLRCLHCYAKCSNVNNQHRNKKVVCLDEWKKILIEAIGLGCRKVQLIGGEPMLFGKQIFKLIKIAKHIGYESIEIFTNATLLSEEDIKLIARYNVKIATSIYSDNELIHDRITRVKGSHRQLMKNITRLKDSGIQVRFVSVIMKQNQSYTKKLVDFFQSLGIESISNCFDIIRCIGRGLNKTLTPNKYKSWQFRLAPNFAQLYKKEFLRRKSGHNCWQDRIRIGSNGDVTPCIMARRNIIGNIKTKALVDIFKNSKARKLQKLSKDKILVCRDCEYRYACVDCRPIAQQLEGNLYAKDPFCLYDPYSGEWGKLEKGGKYARANN